MVERQQGQNCITLVRMPQRFGRAPFGIFIDDCPAIFYTGSFNELNTYEAARRTWSKALVPSSPNGSWLNTRNWDSFIRSRSYRKMKLSTTAPKLKRPAKPLAVERLGLTGFTSFFAGLGS